MTATLPYSMDAWRHPARRWKTTYPSILSRNAAQFVKDNMYVTIWLSQADLSVVMMTGYPITPSQLRQGLERNPSLHCCAYYHGFECAIGSGKSTWRMHYNALTVTKKNLVLKWFGFEISCAVYLWRLDWIWFVRASNYLTFEWWRNFLRSFL